MSQKKIIVKIATDGSVDIDAQGFKGNSCTLATKELETLLVGSPLDNNDRKPKPDFYAANGANRNTNRN